MGEEVILTAEEILLKEEASRLTNVQLRNALALLSVGIGIYLLIKAFD